MGGYGGFNTPIHILILDGYSQIMGSLQKFMSIN